MRTDFYTILGLTTYGTLRGMENTGYYENVENDANKRYSDCGAKLDPEYDWDRSYRL